MPQIRASTPAEAFDTLDPFAVVRPEDPWYADIESYFDRRHYGLVAQLVRRLSPRPTGRDYEHIGIVGHKGSGKTTLVRKAMEELAPKGLHPFYVDAIAAFDQGDLSFSDVILVIARAVIDGLGEAGVDIPAREFEMLKMWFAEELLTESHRQQILASVETEAGAGGSIPWLVKLTAKITAALKSDNEYRREIRQRAERDPVDLVRRANQLLDAAAHALSSRHEERRRLVVVLDNLEKLADRRQVDAAVLRRADGLRELRCHLLLFFAPEDQYAPVTVQADQAFDLITLPMLPVRGRDDGWERVAAPVLDAVRELLARRMDLARVLTEPDAVLLALAKWSGGRLRDIFHLTRLACELSDPDPVTPELMDLAARRLSGERVTAAKPDQWARLAEIARDKQVANDPTDGFLLQHSLVLNYDGEPWWDVHPFVRLDRRFETAWKASRQISGGPS